MKNIHLGQFTVVVWGKCSKHPIAISLFLALCFNLILSPVIYGATGAAITRNTAYALGMLLLVIVSLSFYLFVVIFQPERF
ncbi:potassium-transporting ATPase subunit F [Crocosphaera sp. XPORK-15E]|uniref:potassium-transporting ATPase subunit F n=1 Tax=Crocosphaera sp. XPORK-15E TaxID=3110247 RepID=UPI002B2143C0|nr:potassium-transporting ATPase subunit F [Crocosphaera sp. XPORK-15E]MEA5535998.1 potassium-transporting ATPase subunit F [Crocosphaera sp. XPORK-15E]